MKQHTIIITLLVMFLLISSSIAKDKDKNWELFSQNLVNTIKSENEGLKKAAMQRIIQYSDKLDVKDAAFDLYNLYRWHQDERVRRLALIALYKTNYDWSMRQIAENIYKEQSPTLQRQMMFMVNNYNKS